MERVRITSDSTCDLSPELVAENNIVIAPLHVMLGENEYRDGVDIQPQIIFDYVKETGVLPKTSAVSEQEYDEFFDEQLKSYDRVIHFNISSKCSSSNNDARLSAAKFGGRVDVIDTEYLSTGQGLMVMKACDLLAEGRSADEIVEAVNALKGKVQTSFVVDTVEYLYKGGRCTAAAQVFSKILNIHPAIHMKNGELSVKKKYMGSLRRTILKYVDDLAVEFKDYDDTRVFITHTHCDREIVEAVRAALVEKFSFKSIVETFAGSVVTSHCGQGTLGVLFINK